MKKIIKKIIPDFLISWYHFSLAFLGALLYRFPSRKIKVIGVTGTNGKSTVVDLTNRILEEAGFKIASISSIRFKIGNKEWKNSLKMTMPGRFKIQRFLRNAVDEGCQHIVLEVTSEGILQHRHRFIDFDVVAFTNLTPEHIEAHGSFENYKKAKGRLFQALEKSKKKEKVSIVNLDDENSEYYLKFSADKKIGYGIDYKKSESILEIRAKGIISQERIKFVVKDTVFELNLIGLFNIYNSLTAICIGLSQGIDLETCKQALKKSKVISGRMEEVISSPFKVFVDYAHTSDALLKAYSSLPQKGRKICVLGSCGGGRDEWKRPELGGIASEFCDYIILTNEDPYDEDPSKIIEAVRSGIKKNLNVEEILDRKEAIKKALKIAKAGDVVIITGKGSEPWMCVKNGRKIPWDDREIAKKTFNSLP